MLSFKYFRHKKIGSNLPLVSSNSIKNSDIIDKTPDNYPKNYVLLEIDNRVNDEEILEFQFNIRGAKFKYKLK